MMRGRLTAEAQRTRSSRRGLKFEITNLKSRIAISILLCALCASASSALYIPSPETQLGIPQTSAAQQAQTSPGRDGEPGVTAIVGATLIDGSGRAPVRDSVVVLRGDRIESVGARRRVRVPAGARRLDARGLVVAPGFIDTHNHSGAASPPTRPPPRRSRRG